MFLTISPLDFGASSNFCRDSRSAAEVPPPPPEPAVPRAEQSSEQLDRDRESQMKNWSLEALINHLQYIDFGYSIFLKF